MATATINCRVKENVIEFSNQMCVCVFAAEGGDEKKRNINFITMLITQFQRVNLNVYVCVHSICLYN